ALAQGVAMSERHSNCSTCSALLLPAAISLHIAQGDLTEAARFCQQLNQVAAKYASQLWLAMAQQAYGELAVAQGELENALHAYTWAMKWFRLSGNEYGTARCLSALASIHLARNAMEDAREAREGAQQIFERLKLS
ncbi:MAG TPA: hypothetical protein VFN35_15925, partial [Ktedonobacteraceae bacterium]|nr:hypothetical protein [Ktedonobacteraceae bacterium]